MTCASDHPSGEIQAFVARRTTGPLHWAHLPGGRTNQSWRVTGPACDWVVKRFEPSRANALFPNDPEAESDALRHLAGTGLAPEFIARFETPEGVCLVYQFFTGTLSARTDALTLGALHRLHVVTPWPGLRRVDTRPVALLAQGLSFLNTLETALARRLKADRPQPIELPDAKDVVLHGDPVPTNVLIRGRELRFIDWQCPAMGDATVDLAIALSPAMHHVYGRGPFSEQDREATLAAYPDAQTVERYRQLEPFYRWRMAAYCAWKAAQGEEVYEKAAEAELCGVSLTK
ncbi:phosphotransferase [Celeribacter sp. ULVN23_4]